MKEWSSSETRKTAMSLLSSIRQSDFIVGFIILEKLAGILLPLTRILQTVGMDIVEAFSIVNDTLNLKGDQKKSPDSNFVLYDVYYSVVFCHLSIFCS